jgi:transcriptional regulator with XRE-family HTH domain
MAELDRAAISVRLAESREQAGLTQEEMAEALQRDGTPLHWRTVQNYESPKIDRVPWDLLDQWARVTGTSKEWLLHGEREEDDRLARLEEQLVTVLAVLEELRGELHERLGAESEEPPRARQAT